MRITLKLKKPIENRPSIDRDTSNFSVSEEFAFLLNLFIGLVLGNEKLPFASLFLVLVAVVAATYVQIGLKGG